MLINAVTNLVDIGRFLARKIAKRFWKFWLQAFCLHLNMLL